jgi:LemA protein
LRGALGAGCIAGIVIGAIVLILGLVAVGKYNSLAGSKQTVASKWAEIDNQYKRRSDMTQQLVDTVKGAANYEKTTLQNVVDARASVGRVQMPSELPEDPEKLKAYIQAQQQLSGALSRLFAVAESYPDLKATAGFRGLQDQIEGTENRIAVARRDYIDAVKDFNTRVVTFPGNLVAGIFGFKPLPQLEAATSEERQVPKIDFGDTEKK